ncbi:hypothetical protein [uncultured Helicobacter sp.]|uniref:hypothetical protein n=1 Tax=uncultured Helicobacter sp. TaxID=175537 RepID=UPI002632A161|nr:hypothetical protein [uncultured Helicobacter sp.]
MLDDGQGATLFGFGEGTGDNAAIEAMRMAIESSKCIMQGAKGVLISFETHPDCPMNTLNDAMEMVHLSVDENANVLMGMNTRDNIPADYVSVIILAKHQPLSFTYTKQI